MDIAFSREGRDGSRIMKISRIAENTVCTVSSSDGAPWGRFPSSDYGPAFCPICPCVHSIGALSFKRLPVLTVLTQTSLSRD
jgi:hypothetical protein